MPYEWSSSSVSPSGGPDHSLSLWPYRSLLRRDFVTFIGATAAIMALPLLAMIGTPVLWAILPPLALMLWGVWTAIDVSYRRGEVLEELTLDATTARLARHDPGGSRRDWEANRHWVSVHLYPKGGPVENYLTLRGANREVEIGAFLDVAERLALYVELKDALARS